MHLGSHWNHLTENDPPKIFNQAWIYQKNYRHNRVPSSTGCHGMQFFPPVLRWRNVTVQLLFLIMTVFILLIKVITFLIPVSPTANRQIDKKTRIYNTKNHTAIFLHRSNCQILIWYSLCPFWGMDQHPQPQRTVTEGNDSICLPANASTFLLDLNNAVIMVKNIQWTTAL